MAVGQRRAREIENLRRAILDAARELFATQDYQAVSLRKIAEKIEYSPAAIYRYFDDKEEILFRLIEEGFGILSARVHRLDIEDPVERLRQGGRIYVEFALTQPHYYRLMFQLENRELAERLMPRCQAAPETFGFIRKAVNEARAAGRFKETLPEIFASGIIWSTLHGAVSLALSGYLQGIMSDQFDDAFFDQAIESTIRANLVQP